ncbi:MAG TPA: tRNA (adenosine(37)-N6)-threonylcarbamoyltransferase complex dimerization subunit type 1 TsaB [Bacilli bacterium]|nr:tRNA (adenosine(37)-N6)-threonylcarbamoyltransferase complex dimerization subunit type 1 TsaB [Bacilli bacterium]
MITLLLDSSGTNMSVGLMESNQLLDEINEEAWQRQSEKMVPAIDFLLKKHQLDRRDIEKIIVGIGPGSYTGVRIAVTIAKVIAVALKIDIYPVSSLAILAHYEQPTVCLLNARSNRSYVGVYEQGKTILADTIMSNDEVKDYLLLHPDYLISGKVSYLGLKEVPQDPLATMVQLAPSLKAASQPLAVNPVYLKD